MPVDPKDKTDKEKFIIQEKEITLYRRGKGSDPLIVLNTYTGDGSSVYEKLNELNCPEMNLLVIGNLKWEHDMTPWYAPPLFKDDTSYTGGADEYLDLLLTRIIPAAKERIDGEPSYTAIAGYSLAGLFALFSTYKSDAFDRAASISGSLWFPDFKEYVLKNEMMKRPDKVYISLGDAEDRSRNPLIRAVRNNTEEIVDHYRGSGLDVTYELNHGNHFKDPVLRSAKGILGIIRN